MKVLMAPKNYSGQVFLLARKLNEMGHAVDQLEYVNPDNKPSMGYRSLEFHDVRPGTVIQDQFSALSHALEQDYDIFHFWNRSLVFVGTPYDQFMGIDIMMLKARGKKIIYRFTGNDARLPSVDKAVNPYSFFKYGYDSPHDENKMRRYIDFLRQYVDQFVVQDPELAQFIPEATVIPRALSLDEWHNVGLVNSERPLVLHASTNDQLKGTAFIEKAVQELENEGLEFDYEKVSNLSHDEAVARYRRADICIDNLHQGCLTVFAMEAMALGKATMNYIREDLYQPMYGEVPVENVNPDNVKEKLRKLITDRSRRIELSEQGRRFIEQHFDVDNVAQMLAGLYQKVGSEPSRFPAGTRDFEYVTETLKHFRLSIQNNNILQRSLDRLNAEAESNAVSRWKFWRRSGRA